MNEQELIKKNKLLTGEKKILTIISMMLFSSAYPQNKLTVVSSIDLKKYQGTWYEIARLPNSFERKLKCITATYSLRDDGKIKVVNKGQYLSDTGKQNTATGVAWVPDKNSPAKLKVQFFWPFSGNYWVIDLDKDYRYVMVGEPSFRYFWILAREKTLSETTYQMLLKKAIENGYGLTGLIKTEQNCE